MKDLTGLLFSVMTPKQIERTLDEMYEAYARENACSDSGIADVHFVKRTIVEIVNKLYNDK